MDSVVSKFDTADYKRSRWAYCIYCAFEYFITIIVSDAYLAKVLTDLGMEDTLIGIISSFKIVAFLFQLLSLLLVGRIKNTKSVVMTFCMTSLLLFTALYFIPFLPVGHTALMVIVICLIMIAYIGQYLGQNLLYKWGNSFVEPTKRGNYSAVKEMISLLSGMAVTLLIGFLIDKYEAIGDLHTGFLFTAVAGLIFSICAFICLLMIARDTTTDGGAKPDRKKVLSETLGNKNFINVIILTCLWNTTEYLTVGFLGTFKTSDLLLTVGTVQIINICANLVRFFLSKPIGRYSDKTSFAHGFGMALIVAAAAFAFNAFTTPARIWCIVVYTVLFAVSTAGTNQNSFNIVYSYVSSDCFVHATAIKNSIGGICGFCASLVGSKILEAVQNNGNTLFGLHVYGQQVLSAISAVLAVVTFLFCHFVIDKQKVMKQ